MSFSRKASLDLSINFIVIMIISLLLLGVGFFFLARGHSALENEYAKLEELHKSQIRQAMSRSGTLVVAYPTTITIGRGDGYIFTLGINNEAGADDDFWVVVTSLPPGNTGNKVLATGTAVKIRNTESGFTPVKITTANDQGKVSYLFNICVFRGANPGGTACAPGAQGLYGDIQKVIVNVK